MTSDQLAVERASWAVALKTEFKKLDFVYREHLNDYQTIFVVTSEASPGWKAKVTLCSAHNQRNRIEINGHVAAHGCLAPIRHKIMGVLTSLRVTHGERTAAVQIKEEAAALWSERKRQEVGGLEDLDGVDIEIITRGLHEGKYQVTLQPGNALEHLTLEQVRRLYQFLKTLVVTSTT